MDFPVPENERERVKAVDSYRIIGTPPEPAFDDVAELAAQILDCPVGIINLISDTREWLKAKYGVTPELSEMPRGTTCSTTLCQSDLLVVPDLRKDDRFRELSYVAGEPYCRFYAGMPLINPEGYALGTLCVVDFAPRQITFAQAEAIRRLSRQVVTQLELRRNLLELTAAREALAAEKRKAQDLLLNILPAAIADELEREKRVEPPILRYGDNHVHRLQRIYALRRESGAPQAGGGPQPVFFGIRRDRRSSRPREDQDYR